LRPRIEYDPRLVEQAVNHRVHSDPELEAQLHRGTDSLYELPPSSDRDAQFVGVYAALFERIGLDRTLPLLLDERPVIANSVGACLVCHVLSPAQESAELHVRAPGAAASRKDRTLILQVTGPTLAEPQRFPRRMRPELFHIADMVDPVFRYRRQQIDGLPARKNLIRDRYKVLWNVYIYGRLEREGHGEAALKPRLLAQLAHVFGLESDAAASRAFARVFHVPSLTHEQLFTWANEPHEFSESEAGSPETRGGEPGANCSLCGFSTFDWFVFHAGADDDLVRAVERHYPGWTPARGACRQCAEIYASIPAARA
jgi:hypothetical protein